MDVLDKGGLSINVDVTIIFNPFYNKIGDLHENIGTNYVSVMVIPNVRSAVQGRYRSLYRRGDLLHQKGRGGS